MRRKNATSERPWQEWTERDDRAWLKKLASQKGAPSKIYKDVQGFLDPIVTSLSAPHHSRWAGQLDASELRTLSESFLLWLNETGAWAELTKLWKQETRGPWSLPLFLSRAFLRYRKTLALEPNNEHLAGQRQWLASPTSKMRNEAEQLAGTLSAQMVDAFAALTQQLPEGVRLSYQLHLEGLLNHEIAALLDEPEPRIEAHIHDAKDQLKMPRSA